MLEGLEKEAREAKKGLWVDPAPIPLWVYRKARRGQSLDLSDIVPLDTETDGRSASRGPPVLGAIEQDPASTSSYPVIVNRKSHIYHRPDCPNYSQVAPHNRVAFNSAAEAENAGYRVAGNCPSGLSLAHANEGSDRERPRVIQPSLIEIFNALEGAKRWAQVWAYLNPDYDYRAYKFMKDLDEIGSALNNSVHVFGETRFQSSRHWKTDPSWDQLFIILAFGRAHAEGISERHPEYTVPLKLYGEEVDRVVTELWEKAGGGRPTN